MYWLLFLVLGLGYSYNYDYNYEYGDPQCEIGFCLIQGCNNNEYNSDNNVICNCTNSNYDFVGCCVNMFYALNKAQFLTCTNWNKTYFGHVLTGNIEYRPNSNCYNPLTQFNVDIIGAKTGLIKSFNFITPQDNNYFKIKQSLQEKVYFKVKANNTNSNCYSYLKLNLYQIKN